MSSCTCWDQALFRHVDRSQGRRNADDQSPAAAGVGGYTMGTHDNRRRPSNTVTEMTENPCVIDTFTHSQAPQMMS
jgi:hypothetical protein